MLNTEQEFRSSTKLVFTVISRDINHDVADKGKKHGQQQQSSAHAKYYSNLGRIDIAMADCNMAFISLNLCNMQIPKHNKCISLSPDKSDVGDMENVSTHRDNRRKPETNVHMPG